MTKIEIQNRLRKMGFQSHYQGKTRTFFIDNCDKHYQCLLFNDMENMGYRVVKN